MDTGATRCRSASRRAALALSPLRASHVSLSRPYARYRARGISAVPGGTPLAFGYVPNIAGAMATSPVLIGGLVGLFGACTVQFHRAQIQVLLLTNGRYKRCRVGRRVPQRPGASAGCVVCRVEAIRSRALPGEPGLAALSRLARTLIETRGRIYPSDRDAFLRVGFHTRAPPRGDRRQRSLDHHQLRRERDRAAARGGTRRAPVACGLKPERTGLEGVMTRNRSQVGLGGSEGTPAARAAL